MAEFRRHFPSRFGSGGESHQPLCRWADGQPIYRSEMASWLERAAASQGGPPSRMGTHSLRIGGGTALFNVVGSIEIVKRFGRWRSTAFQGYLWEGDQHAEGMSKAMASHEGKLWAEQRLGAAAAAQHYGDSAPPAGVIGHSTQLGQEVGTPPLASPPRSTPGLSPTPPTGRTPKDLPHPPAPVSSPTRVSWGRTHFYDPLPPG